jgi:hypothetical protein
MPVDQRGENILFVVGDGTVEAHVQIQYAGDPEQFAWIVPVMAVPEIEAGSEQLFQNMLAATVPTFQLTTNNEDCGGEAVGCAAEDARVAADGLFGSAGGTDSADDGENGDPDVVASGTAGAFEYAVLEGGTVDGVVAWLEDNGYAQDDDAPPILGEYLQEGFLFAAFKLQAGTGADEIHPVVIRYVGTEPCVPIRLTRIAADPDMAIRAFFLGEARAAPTNYRSVEINLLAIDWVGLGRNYDAVVTQAVDVEGSNGHGFVTEYAGPSNVVGAFGILSESWDASKFVGIAPEAVYAELMIQGLQVHPLIAGILERHLPRPAGVVPLDFYECVECYLDEETLAMFDASAFVEDLESRIIAPAEHAVDLLASHRYLTRLYTTISPEEMTTDPIFHVNADLPDVANVYDATRVNTCEGADYLVLPDGRRLAIDDNGDLPQTGPARRIDEVPERGAPMMLVDDFDAIENDRSAWNAAHELGDDGCNCRAKPRNTEGLLWLSIVLGFAYGSRRRALTRRSSS